ncbi:GntR family transcriptional regulator [Sporosarcina luteola]|uniref:GntR family transcriptional regulator n=1 Tax=Sporosarcina luteola TaxID=582850 RepID=UPI002040E560|nr:GntR family transcriptional regulator [Sporosarcina luteola]MCM3709145.1 GntR family transcriptional regulator [Sporosarcina luteola]
MKTESGILQIGNEGFKSLREIVVEKLREAIITGYFEPGSSLRERDISEMMGISTTPIKEAFRILEHEGLIKSIPRSGTFVSDLVDTNIHEVQMLRASVEGLAARLMALKATPEQLKRLEEQIIKMETLLEGNETDLLVEENSKFHNLIRECSESPMISQVLRNAEGFSKAFRKRALQQTEEKNEGYKEHREIFEAIKARNADLADELMRKHILRTVSNVLGNFNKWGSDI